MVILITGVSSGFGRQTARLLAERGHKVYGTVRRECDEIKMVTLLKMDLTDYESVSKCVETVCEKEKRIDVLINNAGIHTGGPVETLPAEWLRLQMETNFFGTVNLTREVLPVMRKQGGGRIINLSSIGGLMGLPMQGYYSACKFALEGFSEALRMEVRAFNIKVVVIEPGDFHTSNTFNRRKYMAPTGPEDPYRQQFEKTMSVIENDETSSSDPVILARKLVRIAEYRNPREHYIIATFEQKLSVFLKRILPGKLFTRIVAGHYGI